MQSLFIMLALLSAIVGTVTAQCQPRPLVDHTYSLASSAIANDTSFNDWNFYAVNPANVNESVSINFVAARGDAYPLRGLTNGYVFVHLALGLANGSVYKAQMNSVPSQNGGDERANLTVSGYGTNSTWGNTGVAWLGSSRGAMYTVHVSHDKLGIHGTMTFKAAAGPRYPCTSDMTPVSTLELLPHLGQTNQMPAAAADAHFTIQRDSISKPQYLDFRNGIGFHDQTWSDIPLPRAVKTWRRGHVRMNPVGAHGMPDASSQNHTVVWWQGETHDGQHRWSSVYAVHDGTIVEEGCDRNNKGVLNITTSATSHNVSISLAPGMILQLDISKAQRLLEIKDLDVGRWTGKVKAALGDVMLAGAAWIEEGIFRSDTTQWGPPGARDGYVVDA